jgi:hypothetical protein
MPVAGLQGPSAAAVVFVRVPTRAMSFRCRLDPCQLLEQLTRGSKPLRGKVAAATVARATEPSAVEFSSPAGHLLEAVKPEESDAPLIGAPLVPGIIPGTTTTTNPCNPRR